MLLATQPGILRGVPIRGKLGSYIFGMNSSIHIFRFALNIKKLPYKTSWLEYPDIEPLAKKIGAEPTDIFPDGPYYSVPIIHDPSTSSVVADSFKIVQYLDKTYPDTPILIPKGTAALQLAFADIFFEKVGFPVYQHMNLQCMKQLPSRSQVHWRRTREARFGIPIEEIAPEGSEKRASLWKETIKGLATMTSWLSAEDGTFVMGDKPSFADLMVASVLTWIKRILGEDSKEWNDVLSADGGRWKRMMAAFDKWEAVDEDGLKYKK